MVVSLRPSALKASACSRFKFLTSRTTKQAPEPRWKVISLGYVIDGASTGQQRPLLVRTGQINSPEKRFEHESIQTTGI